MPDPAPLLSRTPSPVSSPSVYLFLLSLIFPHLFFSTLKRKDRPDEPLSSTNPLPNTTTTTPQEEEYEAGRVICQVCGTGIAFRDEATNEFTMKHWDAHRLAWYWPFISSSLSSLLIPFIKAHHHLPLDPRLERPSFTPLKAPQRLWPILLQNEGVLNAPKKSASTTSNPTLTSQNLRIAASFVLRQMDTCSIPWDAHRKSCLVKKMWVIHPFFVALFISFHFIRNNKNVYALDERNTLFSKDPDVRKFDAERLLCNMCDKWMNVPPDDHLQAVQKWLQHRASCQKTASSSTTLP